MCVRLVLCSLFVQFFWTLGTTLDAPLFLIPTVNWKNAMAISFSPLFPALIIMLFVSGRTCRGCLAVGHTLPSFSFHTWWLYGVVSGVKVFVFCVDCESLVVCVMHEAAVSDM